MPTAMNDCSMEDASMSDSSMMKDEVDVVNHYLHIVAANRSGEFAHEQAVIHRSLSNLQLGDLEATEEENRQCQDKAQFLEKECALQDSGTLLNSDAGMLSLSDADTLTASAEDEVNGEDSLGNDELGTPAADVPPGDDRPSHFPPAAPPALARARDRGRFRSIESQPGAYHHSVNSNFGSSSVGSLSNLSELLSDVETPNPTVENLIEAHVVEEVGSGQREPEETVLVEAVPESKFVFRTSFFGRTISVNLLVVAIVGILLVGLITIIATTTNGKQDQYPGPAQDPSTLPQQVTPPPSNGTRLDSLRSFLTAQVTPNETLFDDPTTPQYKALHWVADEDPAQISLVTQPEYRLVQRYVLAVLYHSTGGSNWVNSTGFLTGDHECEWRFGEYLGVTECFEHWGKPDELVSTLWLYWNNLTGTIPNELGSLSYLCSLNFSINRLEGTIPDSLGTKSVKLNQLFLNNNGLEGTVPASLTSLTDLEALSLHDNPRLTGDLDFLCRAQEIPFFTADCGGTSATVSCTCCSHCCDMEASECCETSGNSSSGNCWDPTPKRDWHPDRKSE